MKERIPVPAGDAALSTGTAQPMFSVVAPVYDEEETLPAFYTRVVAVMEQLREPFEIVLVDDGSRDRSWEIVRELAARDTRVRGLSFSRNFGHQMALSAGMTAARGRAVILIDADLQTRPR